MFENGFDAGYIIRHPLFLATFIIAVPAWIVAFAGQCATEAQYDIPGTNRPVVGVLWFAIWIQLAITIHLFLAIATNQLAIHRFQLAVVTAVVVVFAVIGVNDNIYTGVSARVAVGAGWLLIAIVDLVWLLYLTSEEDSTIYRLLNAGGNGGLSSSTRRSRKRESAAAFSGGHAHENGIGGGNGGGIGGGYGGGNGTPRTATGLTGNGGYPMGGYANAGVDTTPVKASAATGDYHNNTLGSPAALNSGGSTQRAKAMYAYSASPDDPNEVSFAKGDMLDVIDGTGKWFQVRAPNGQTGIAPSNYLTLL